MYTRNEELKVPIVTKMVDNRVETGRVSGGRWHFNRPAGLNIFGRGQAGGTFTGRPVFKVFGRGLAGGRPNLIGRSLQQLIRANPDKRDTF